MTTSNQAIAILRRCRACGEWRSIDAFVPLGRICQRCVTMERATGRTALARSIVVTAAGREAVGLCDADKTM